MQPSTRLHCTRTRTDGRTSRRSKQVYSISVLISGPGEETEIEKAVDIVSHHKHPRSSEDEQKEVLGWM